MQACALPSRGISEGCRRPQASSVVVRTYYIKSAADDTRLATAKLEKLVIGSPDTRNSQSGNEVTTLELVPQLPRSSKRSAYWRVNLAAAGLEPATYGL